MSLPAAPFACGPLAGAALSAAVLLLAGFVLLGDGTPRSLFARAWGPAAALGAALVAASVPAPESVAGALRGLGAWTLALAALGFALVRLAGVPAAPRRIRELGMPLLVLSRPVVVAIGCLLSHVALGPVLRTMTVMSVSLPLLGALCAAVRLWNPSRFVVGLLPLDATRMNE